MAVHLIDLDPVPDVSMMKECRGKFQLSCQKATVDINALDTDDTFDFPGPVTLHKSKTEGELV